MNSRESSLEHISKRENEIIILVIQGLRNKEIASRLSITEKTVKFHLTNIYKKLNLKSRTELVVRQFTTRSVLS